LYNYIDFSKFKADEILIYLRKSRSDDPFLSVEEVLSKHEAILDEWAEQKIGEKIIESNRIREIESGETIADRPGIQLLLKKIESPKYKAILIVEVQRLSRGDLEDAGRIIKLLRYSNTLVITPQKTYDLSDEYDRDMFERELKRGNEFLEYTKKIMNRGRLLSVSEGNYIASIPPYGYDKVWVMDGKRKCPTLAINPEQAKVIKMMFEMYVYEDLKMSEIANRFDALGIAPPNGKYWSKAGLKDMLINVHYIGKVKWNWRKTVTVVENSEIVNTRPKAKYGEYLIYDGKHEAIISEDLFNAAQEKLGKNHRTREKYTIKNPLASILKCHCGKSMLLRTYTKKGRPSMLVCTDQTHCKTGSCSFDEMMNLVVDILKQCISDFEIKIENESGDVLVRHEKILKNLEHKMQDLEAKELAQWEAQANPDPTQRMPAEIFKKLNEKLLKEKAEIKEAIHEARKHAPNPAYYEEKLYRFTEALNALLDPNVSAEEKNKLLKTCIEKIEYNRKAPERVKNPEKKTRKNSRMKGKYVKQNALKVGGQWSTNPIEIDVKLKM
jgi:hypothetical protein